MKDENCGCIPGVYCEVKNCVHNDEQRRCTAEEIKVGGNTASSINETACDTFQCR